MSPNRFDLLKLLFIVLINGLVSDATMKSEPDTMSSLFSDPCAFPDFSDTLSCGIYDSMIQRNSFVCDPFGSMSVSELRLLSSTVNEIRNSKQTHCTCETGNCFYKYGFAFLNQLDPLPNRTADNFDSEYCPQLLSKETKTEGTRSATTDDVLVFAQNYARLIRERNFKFGDCGEEILVLVVKETPTGMFWHSSSSDDYNTDYYYKPRIFVSYGQLIMDRFVVTDPFNGANYLIEPLQEISNEENSRLQNGFPIVQVLSSFVQRTDDALRNAAQTQNSVPQVKTHVPDWAWMVFGVCGILFVLMGIGLYLLRSQTKRSTFHGNPHMEQRKWKAGFVGEENQPPTTYVNVLSQMMSSKQQNINQQQNV